MSGSFSPRAAALTCLILAVCCVSGGAAEGKRVRLMTLHVPLPSFRPAGTPPNPPSRLLQVEVATIPSLVEAFNDPNVSTVVMTSAELNVTESEMPFNAAVVDGRNVTLEGATQPDGSLVHIDANALGARILVVNGSELTQRNFWVDDCILDGFPFTCFATPGPGGGRIGFFDGVFSDGTCETLDKSSGIASILTSAKVAQGAEYKEEDISDRAMRIIETGWVPYAVDGAEWRMSNITVSCTAGVTQPLLDDGEEGGPASPVSPVPPASAARGGAVWVAAALGAAAAGFV